MEVSSISMKNKNGKNLKNKNRWKVVIVWKTKKIKRKRPLLYLHCGCKVNQYETNAMAQKFLEKGYEIIEEETKENENKIPDICIINTCTVTNMSDRKSRQMLRRVKENNEKTIVVACRMLCTSG